MRASLFTSLLVTLIACDGSTPVDAGSTTDAGATFDAGSATDAGSMTTDAGPTDAGSVADAGPATDAGDTDAGPAMDAGDTDAGPAMDAGTDAGTFDGGGVCHAQTFGGPAVTITAPAGSAPTPAGGVIALGSYDLVRVQSYGGTPGGRMRSTLVFETASQLQELTALNFTGGALPTATPRTRMYRTAGTRIQSRRTCGGDSMFDNGYSVRSTAGRQELLLIQGSLVLTYALR